MKPILLIAAISMQGFCLSAQTPFSCLLTPSYEYLHGNNIRLKVNANGQINFLEEGPVDIGFDGSTPLPLGLYAAGVWIGGFDSEGGQLRLARSNNFNLDWSDYYPGPLGPGGVPDPANCQVWNRVWKVTRTEIELHKNDFADDGLIDHPIAAVIGWPGIGNPFFESIHGFTLPPDTAGLAPFFDQDGDGLYNPYQGDYPHPVGLAPSLTPAEMVWHLFNSGGSNIAFDIQVCLWALSCADNELLNNTYFQTYRFISRGSTVLDSLHIGIYQRAQIGCVLDDLIGTNTDLQTVFVYNQDNQDDYCYPDTAANYGANPPVTALTFLNRPLSRSMYHIAPNFSDPPLDMLSPETKEECFQALTGHWLDGEPLIYGGYGYNPQIPDAALFDYYYTGNPGLTGTWWQNNSLNNVNGDERTLAIVALDSLAPGEPVLLETAFVYSRGDGLNNLENVAFAFDRIEQLRQLYGQQFEVACSFTPCYEDCVWPGDADRNGIVDYRDLLPLRFAWNDSGASRSGANIWAPQQALNWGQNDNLGYDNKHLDANGNGKVDVQDISLMREFYGNRVPWWTAEQDSYPAGHDFNWLLTSGVDTNQVQSGNTFMLAVDLKPTIQAVGAAFEMEWDTAYWDAAPLDDQISSTVVSFCRFQGTALSSASIRIHPVNIFSGSISSRIQLTAKSIPPTQPATTCIRLKNIKAVAPDGSPLVLGAQALKFVFAGGASAAETPPAAPEWRLSPNPATAMLRIEAPGEQLQEAVFFDPSGRALWWTALGGGEHADVAVGHLPRGLVWVHIRSAERMAAMRIVLR